MHSYLCNGVSSRTAFLVSSSSLSSRSLSTVSTSSKPPTEETFLTQSPPFHN